MFKFSKKQRLCNVNAIERLFIESNSFTEHPFRIVWRHEENNGGISIKSLIVVPKKRLKLAVERNLIKRRISNAYRIQKKSIEFVLKNKRKQINLAIIYQEEKVLKYKLIEEKINLLLSRLQQKL